MKVSKRSVVAKVDALRRTMTVHEACKKAGIAVATYYYYKTHTGGARTAAAPTPAKPQKLKDGSLMLIVVPPAKAKRVFKELSKLLG